MAAVAPLPPQPAAAPTRISSTPPSREATFPKRRAGLTTQIEIHDRHQLEIRSSYALRSDEGRQRYTVETYFFIPRNVGLNRTNYTRAQFYADVTALFRLDASPLPLEQLGDPTHTASPLHRFAQALEQFRTAKRPPSSTPVVVQAKLYAFLYTLGVKAELAILGRRLRDPAMASEAGRASFEQALDAALGRMRAALWSYRSVRAAFWPFEHVAHRSTPEAMRAADEYMSLFLEERLAMFATTLDGSARRFDGSGFVARCRLRIEALAREEARYRQKYGYLTLTGSGLAGGEYFTYRASLVKKAVQGALYLDPREVRADPYVRNAVGAVGAALAAIWALATQLPATLAEVPGSTKMLFFVSAVAAYVLKDRIKAVTNEALTGRLLRYDHTSWLTGESLASIGLDMLRARLRESMQFLRSSEVPPEVLAMRLAHRTVRNAETATEEVIRYRKVVDVTTRDETERLPDDYWVRDILRLNVRHFLVRLDDPLDSVAFFDPERDAFGGARLPKVYHVNVVKKITREGEGGAREERLERLRVVLNKDGIVRVDEVERRPPTVLPAEPRRRFFTFWRGAR